MSSELKLPNFLIPGAAKSGTTSLYSYLRAHPDIFMPSLKEPLFFVADELAEINSSNPRRELLVNKMVSNLEDYYDLFRDVQNEKAIGEASVYYLYYWKTAIPAIKKRLGDVRIIIGLRNPIERAYSSYLNLIRDGHETLSFEESMKLENQRELDGWKALLYLYRRPGLYAAQVQAYLDNFSNVKVYLFDDFKLDSQSVVTECCEFLDLDPSFQINAQRRHHNSSLIPKNNAINKILFQESRIRSSLDTLSKPFLSEERKSAWIQKIRQSFSQKNTINSETRERLKDYFKEDISKLEGVINKDLSRWR